jgi:microcystin-dependent protein
MSIRRLQSRVLNQRTYLGNRFTNFTTPPIYTGDLIVERDETVNGNLTIKKNLHANNFYASGNYYLDTFVLIPAGTIIMSAAVVEPGGWLDCDGRQLSVHLYEDLFSAIQYTFGGSDISFNIPDMRGRAGIGLGQGTALTNRTLASVGGAETHTLSTSEIPGHDHTGTTDMSGNHTHSSNAIGGQGNYGLAYANGSSTVVETDTSQGELNVWTTPGALTINAAGVHNHTFTTNSTGGGGSHNNMQPYVVLRYLIKF